MILIIDNYDSFTYNLVQAIGALDRGRGIKVVLNDQVTIAGIEAWSPSHILLSPGPCSPREAGISVEVVRAFAGRVPILGVCLGHQCIGEAFGGKTIRADRIMHGNTSPILHLGTGIYRGLSNPFTAARYHSLVVEPSAMPDAFERTAWTDRNELMGFRHQTMKVEGVQFHPESFLTPEGSRLIENFLIS